jgi:hypothetical protein
MIVESGESWVAQPNDQLLKYLDPQDLQFFRADILDAMRTAFGYKPSIAGSYWETLAHHHAK